MFAIRACRDSDFRTMLEIINSAATAAYRGIIPERCWHEPYMSSGELHNEIGAGVVFSGYEVADQLVGVMGMQRIRNVNLIRHAYVLPVSQGRHVGSSLIKHLLNACSGERVLVGTCAAAEWAIGFYRRHGFVQVGPELKRRLLESYWAVSERQIDTSVVLTFGAPEVWS